MSLRAAAAAGMCLFASGAEADGEGAALPRVEVVGSRVPRIDGETALPVQIIRRDEIERSGVATVEELLNLVSANFGGNTASVEHLLLGGIRAVIRVVARPGRGPDVRDAERPAHRQLRVPRSLQRRG